MSDTDRKRQHEKERKRRQRARERRGERVYPCVANNEDIHWLIDLGWLRLSESENPDEVAAAIMAALRSARDRRFSVTRGQPSGSDHGL